MRRRVAIKKARDQHQPFPSEAKTRLGMVLDVIRLHISGK
jgi:hypothetical protein